MLMPSFPSQLGCSYSITSGIRARTRTIFSLRMLPGRQRRLAQAMRLARDSLVYTLGRIEVSFHRWGGQRRPEFSSEMSFDIEFKEVFNIRVHSGEQYRGFLMIFNSTCHRILHGLVQPQEIVDVNIMNQGKQLGGYVTNYLERNKKGRIHLDFDELKPGAEWFVASLLIHEASHKFADTKDYAYRTQVQLFSSMPSSVLLRNADSIAVMVSNTYQKHLR